MRCDRLILAAALITSLPLVGAAQDPAAKAELNAPADRLVWKTAAPSPFARVEAPTAALDGKLYLFGGFTDDFGASAEIDVYDPASDAWTRRKDMPTGVTHLNPAVDKGTIWFAGGFKGKHPGPVTAEVWKYDVAADTWSPGPPLPEPRAPGAGGRRPPVALLRRLFARSQYRLGRSLDVAARWRHAVAARADLPDPRGHLSSAVLGGKIYALGGEYGHDIKQVDSKSAHVFDSATGNWSAIASLPDGRSHTESSTIERGGRILMVGGRCNSSSPPRDVVNDLIQYDPATDSWSAIGSMPQPLLRPRRRSSTAGWL